MKKLFLAIAILALSAGASYAQDNGATKPAQEKTKHIKKSDAIAKTTQPAVKHATSSKKADGTNAVAATKSKHHKKMKKEKAAGK